MDITRSIGLSLCLLLASGCHHYGYLVKRESEINCPTDIRQTVPWCAGEDAVFHCPCGPQEEFYGYKPTCWGVWPAPGATWRDAHCGPLQRDHCSRCATGDQASPNSPTQPLDSNLPMPSDDQPGAASSEKMPLTSPSEGLIEQNTEPLPLPEETPVPASAPEPLDLNDSGTQHPLPATEETPLDQQTDEPSGFNAPSLEAEPIDLTSWLNHQENIPIREPIKIRENPTPVLQPQHQTANLATRPVPAAKIEIVSPKASSEKQVSVPRKRVPMMATPRRMTATFVR